MNSKAKGDIAVGRAIQYYSSKNYTVLIPIGDKNSYDLVIDTEQGLKKVQCKYSSRKIVSGAFEIPLRVMGGNQSYHTIKKYKKGDFDILFAITSDGNAFEIPYDKIEGMSTKTVSDSSEFLVNSITQCL